VKKSLRAIRTFATLTIRFHEPRLLNLLTVYSSFVTTSESIESHLAITDSRLIFIRAQTLFAHLPTGPLPALQSSGFVYSLVAAGSRKYFIRFAADTLIIVAFSRIRPQNFRNNPKTPRTWKVCSSQWNNCEVLPAVFLVKAGDRMTNPL